MKGNKSGLNSSRTKWLLVIISQFCFYGLLKAQVDSLRYRQIVHSVGFVAGFDYVASSVEDDIRGKVPASEKISVHSMVPINLRYNFSFTDPRIRNYIPEGYQGVSVGVLNFGALGKDGFSKSLHNIGYPILVYIFQGAPFHHFNSDLSLHYEWNFGAACGWKPYSEFNRYFNLTVGSRVNAYLNLSFFLQWSISKTTSIFGGLAASHFSNGNTSFPNPGVNSLGVRLGMVYTLNPQENGYPDCLPDSLSKKKLEYDISLWGASRRRVYKGSEDPILLPGHFACAGISFAPMVRLGRWWRIGGSVDIQWDQSSDKKTKYISGTTSEDIKFSSPDFFRQINFGVSAHCELQMPIFAVNIGCGYNCYAPKENRGSYQNITLKTYIGSHFFINIGYQLRNFQQQSSLMLGAGLTI